ncbi:transposase [Jhaorihella thermophila]
MDGRKDTGPEVILEQLIEHGADDMASVSARAFELAMRIARERFLAAGHYERTPSRRGYANGTKPKRIDTPAGWISVQIPKTAGREGEPFFPPIAGARPPLGTGADAGGGRDVHQGRVRPRSRGR